MGTSSSNGGPVGKSSLLPTWAQNIPVGSDTKQDDEINQNDQAGEKEKPNKDLKSETGKENGGAIQPDTGKTILDTSVLTDSWGTTKRALSSSIKKGGKSRFTAAARQYVRSNKGSRNATSASRRGVAVGGNYVNFLSGVSSLGFEQTLRNYNLEDCIGKSSDEVFARIVDVIAPSGSTTDDAIARNALISAMEKLWEKQLGSEIDSANFNSLSEEDVKESIIEFTSAYIFQKWIFEAGIVLEKNGMSEKDIIDREIEVRQFIYDEVKTTLSDNSSIKLDYRSGRGKEIIEQILELAYSTLES